MMPTPSSRKKQPRREIMNALKDNRVYELLLSLGICRSTSIEHFYDRVRDRPDVSVLRCNHSGVIFLSRSDHVEMRHYEEQTGSQYWGAPNRAQAIARCLEDTCRRSDYLRPI